MQPVSISIMCPSLVTLMMIGFVGNRGQRGQNKNGFIYVEKILSTSFTSQKPDVNGETIELFSTYESRNICCK